MSTREETVPAADESPPAESWDDVMAAGEEVAPDADGSSGEPSSPEENPTPEGQAEGIPATESAGQARQAAPALEPFRPRIDGKDLEIPGAYLGNGHVIMPREVWDRHVRPRLVQDRLQLRNAAREEGRKMALADIEARVEQEPVVVQARVIRDEVEKLLERGPEAVAQWAAAFVQNYPILNAKAEAEIWKQRASRMETGEQGRNEQEEHRQLMERAENTITTYVSQALSIPGAERLSAERLANRLRYDSRTFVRAPEAVPHMGIAEGDLVFNTDLLAEIMQDELARLPQGAAPPAISPPAMAHAQRNAETLAPPAGGAPVVSRSGAGQTRARKEKVEPKSLEEWRESLLR